MLHLTYLVNICTKRNDKNNLWVLIGYPKCINHLAKLKIISNYLFEKRKYLYVNEEPINSNMGTWGIHKMNLLVGAASLLFIQPFYLFNFSIYPSGFT